MSTSSSGRPARARKRGLDLLGVEDHDRAARRAEHHVGALELLGDAIAGNRHAAELGRELLGALDPVVRDEDLLGSALEEARGRERAHLARADQEDPLAGERPDGALGQRRGGGRNRGGQRPHPGLVADALARVERQLERARQHRPGRVGLRGELVRLAHLAEDLRLAGKQRIEPRGDAEEVERRVDAAQLHEEVRVAEHRAGTGRGHVRIVACDVELGAVAGRERRPPRVPPPRAVRRPGTPHREPGAAAREGRATRCGGTLPRARVKPRNTSRSPRWDATTVRRGEALLEQWHDRAPGPGGRSSSLAHDRRLDRRDRRRIRARRNVPRRAG